MNVAFVTQPYDRVLPPGQNSIGLIVYNTALELSGEAGLTLYLKKGHTGGAAGDLPFETDAVDVPFDDLIHRAVCEYPRWARRLGVNWLADAHPQYARRVRARLDRADSGIVHVMNYWNWCRQIRGRPGSRKIVLEMQCEWLSQMDRRAVATQLQAVDAVVGVSDHITGLFQQAFPEYPGLVATAYNGVDVERFRPAGEPGGGRDGGPRILFVGRVSPEKGVHTLLEAFARVASGTPEARLDIVGARATLASEFIVDISEDPLVRALKRFYDGSVAEDYQRYLDESVTRLGLGEKVRFLGPMPHDELVATYRASDLVVNPSLSESFGISIVEGMASGVPVIGTRVGGMLETIVHDETGLLVRAEQPQELANAMLAVLADRAMGQRMGGKGRQRAVERFSWRARAERLLSVYRAVEGAPSIS